MKFSTIFFDVDYCLLDTPTSERRIIRELYAQQGQQVGDEVGDTYREINKQLWVYLDRGEITRERLYVKRFERLFEIYPFFKPAEAVAPWFLDQLANAHDAQVGAAHLLARLKDAGVRVFTASNGIGEIMNGRVAAAGLSQYLTGKFAAQITTSKHFYDVTAHRYIQDNCHDLGLKYIRGLSADMDDLLNEKGQKEARNFFDFVCWSFQKPQTSIKNLLCLWQRRFSYSSST